MYLHTHPYLFFSVGCFVLNDQSLCKMSCTSDVRDISRNCYIGSICIYQALFLLQPKIAPLITTVYTTTVFLYIINTPACFDIFMLSSIWYDMIYLLTAIGLSPGGSSTVHIYTQTIHRTIQNKQYIEQHNNWKSVGRAPSWLVMPWHLPYNRGKSTEKPQSG